MKTPKSSDNEEVTPSKKVLKQARLPFKIISDVSPKSASPQTRKRKLSAPEPQPVTKVGKITKENELDEPLVVISDDESKDAPQNTDKKLNPFVKLVDTAWKKKLQKSKAAKKRKNSKLSKKDVCNSSIENNENTSAVEHSDKGAESLEEMEVDEIEETHCVESNEKETSDKIENLKDKNKLDPNIILLEDSNCSENSSSNKLPNSINTEEKHDSEDESDQKSENMTDITSSTSKVIDSKNESCEESTEKHNSENEAEKNVDKKQEAALTPKPSSRKKSKTDEKNLNTSLVSNCDESFNSSPSTPRRSARNVSVTNSQGDVSLNESTNTNLTPKQVSFFLYSFLLYFFF